MKASVFNLGCKVNQYEGDSLLRAIHERGIQVVDGLEYADVYILNTCAVTAEAERKSRQAVARIRRINPNAKLFVCGCASQRNPSQFVDKQGVVYVGGTSHKMLLSALDEAIDSDFEITPHYEDDMRSMLTKTRAFIKIQDGCNNFCSYCIVPYLRGRSRSRSVDSILSECMEKSAVCDEIVLTGIDISSFKCEDGRGLDGLLKKLSSVDCYIRLGSLEVGVVTSELLKATSQLKHFCPHFHLSLQSGSDRVLRSMNRHYDTEEYAARVELIRSVYPNASITTDIIVGFPTETDEDFDECCKFVRRIGFADIHVFPYSPRSGTVAFKLGKLSNDVVAPRCARLDTLKRECVRAKLQSVANTVTTVLTEECKDGYVCGYTPDYVRVRLTDCELHRRYNIELTGITPDGTEAFGKIIGG